MGGGAGMTRQALDLTRLVEISYEIWKKKQYYNGWLRRIEIQENKYFHELRNSTVFLVILAVNIIHFLKQN